MDWNLEALMALRVLVASALGAFIGWERERHGREAGVRTYGAVALGACVFAIISTHVIGGSNPHVIAAGVVTGVGFLGAGVILRDQGSIVGLTTAATLWATASVGLAIGYGMYTLGALVSLIVFGLLAAHHLHGWRQISGDRSSAHRKDPVDRGMGYPGKQASQPLGLDQAKLLLENQLRTANTPNLKLGKVTEEEGHFLGEISTEDGSLVDKIQVDKKTGAMRSAY